MSISRRLDRLEQRFGDAPEPCGDAGEHPLLGVVLAFHLQRRHPEILDKLRELESGGDPAIRDWIHGRLDEFVDCINAKRRCTCGFDILSDWLEQTGNRLNPVSA